ncbi:MAG: peptidoglycan-binding protein [Timaviella obliquedivisa GSE-PSE-MK23-08B]|nr:peptidoglycan-binding protein [Timaviella obliquedivisa GSE-PSE-MK23-08B]
MKISAMNSRYTRLSNSPRASFLPVVPLAGLFVEIAALLFIGLGQGSAFAQERPRNTPAATPTAQPGGGIRPILTVGDRSESVSELQAMLKLLGYYTGTVDGVYQEGTATAVSAFQRAAGLTADGVAGTATWNRLLPVANTATPVTPTPTRPSPVTPAPVTPAPSPVVAQPTTISLPILRLGTRGSAISQLQQRLRRLGFFNGVVDGVFGAETENAVKAVQQNYGLDADGVVGSATWDALLQ